MFLQVWEEGNFMKEFPKSRQGSGNPGNKTSRLQLLHQKEFHLVLLVLAEEQIACMLSIVSKRKRNHYMLLLVSSMSLTLLFIVW